MTAKQYLMRARRLQARIDQLEETRIAAWERATATTQAPRSDGGGHSGISRKPETYALANAVEAARKRLDVVKAETVVVIDRVQDNTLAALLMAYYVNGHTWEQTADIIHYSYYRTVHDKHPQALSAVAEIIAAEKML